MAPDDSCRLCKVNMRESGPRVYAHSTDMFVSKTTPSISERLAALELLVSPQPLQSNRCCQRCSSALGRLEKDLPLFRRWEENVRFSNVSKRQREPSPSQTPRKKTCPNSSGNTTTTKVIINYPSQTLTRECPPEEEPIIKCIALKRWKEAASHALKHRYLQDELKEKVIKLIRKECDVLCSRKYNFILFKSKPADLKSFSFKSLRDDLHRLAPFLFSCFNCVTNNNVLASCAAAAVAIRGRQPQLAALSYWINTVLQFGGAKKSVFNRLSKLSITTSYKKAVKKQHELALGCGADFEEFKIGLKATDTELSEGIESLEDLHLSGVQVPALSPGLGLEQEVPESPELKEEPEEQREIKEEEELLPVSVPDFITVCVKEESPQSGAVSSETEELTEHSDDSYNEDRKPCGSSDVSNSTSQNPPGAAVRERRHQCLICKRRFGYKQILQKHIRVHTGERPFSCSVCSKSFARKDYLDKHRLTHSGRKSYSCSVCGDAFPLKGALRKHVRKHTKENPTERIRDLFSEREEQSCPFCQKTFSTSQGLQAHIRVHTGDTPFSCSLCEKAYCFESELKRHMQTHTGEKPFSCSHCEAVFASSNTLKIHTKKHTGETLYSCSLCRKTFMHAVHRDRHTQSHSQSHAGPEPLSQTQQEHHGCSFCSATFSTEDELESHLKTHTLKFTVNELEHPESSLTNDAAAKAFSSSAQFGRERPEEPEEELSGSSLVPLWVSRSLP